MSITPKMLAALEEQIKMVDSMLSTLSQERKELIEQKVQLELLLSVLKIKSKNTYSIDIDNKIDRDNIENGLRKLHNTGLITNGLMSRISSVFWLEHVYDKFTWREFYEEYFHNITNLYTIEFIGKKSANSIVLLFEELDIPNLMNEI